jgi:ABC-2 type transport system permease protein
MSAATVSPAVTGGAAAAPGSAFVGTGALVRLALRRDRVLLPVWLAVFVLMAWSSAVATIDLYPTAQSRLSASGGINNTPALVALYGRIYDPTSIGEISLIKMTGMGAAMVALLAIVLVVRHTRADEEAGRLELVGAGVVGRRAPLGAALLLSGLVNLVLGVLTAVALMAAGLDAAGSWAFGLAWMSTGLVFGGVAAVAAQLTNGGRAAIGIGSAALGVFYLLRAVGDTAATGARTWLSWLSPIGWGQQVRPYAENRWWVLLLMLSLATVASAAAFALADRRDLGAGLLADRPGPARGADGLGSPLGLAWRLQRPALLGWTVGFALLGAVLGGIVTSLDSFLDTPQAAEYIRRLGGQTGLRDAFLAADLGFVSVFAAAFGIQAANRLRQEEEAGRAEPVLAGAVGRIRWVAGHGLVALLGTAWLVTVGGLAAGLAYAASAGDGSQVGRVLGAALVQIPAAWVLVAVVLAGFGLVPRVSALGWAALVAFLLLGELGPLLKLPRWALDLSPFSHTPKLPGAAFTATPLVGLLVVAAALLAAGLAGAQRRDLR